MRRIKRSKAASKKGPSPQASAELQQLLHLGVSHHQAGRLDQAERIYRRIIEAQPDHDGANHMLGVVAHQMGHHEAAVGLISKAIVKSPGVAAYYGNLGNALRGAGRLDEAVEIYRKAISIKPDYAEAHYNLGNAFKDTGRPDDAVECYRKAIEMKPDYADAYNNLGNTLRSQMRLDEAVECYSKTISIDSGLAADALYNMGNTFRDMNRLDDAMASYRKLLEIKPGFAEAHIRLGIVFMDQERLAEAEEQFKEALKIEPDNSQAHNNLGVSCYEQGRLDEAEECYRRALGVKPDYAEAYRHLAHIKKFSEYDGDVRAMEEVYGDSNTGDEQRMHLAFGLGKAFEDLKQYEKAFGFLAEGNAIKRGMLEYSSEEHAVFFAKLKDAFDGSLFEKWHGKGCPDETPIFILGMPRSGTSLVEQILASHPQVHGAGEREILTQITTPGYDVESSIVSPEDLEHIEPGELERLGEKYVDLLRRHSREARFITDKLPNNFLCIGLIKLILPNAKVIHCRRDPVDNCLSMFKNYFTVRGHYYTYDLIELGRCYNLYRDLMEHWHGLLPGFIHDVQYEEMVADQEQKTRDLLEFCGLEWNDACLEFYKTDRPVSTASGEQVRRPVYKDSVQLWKRYEKQLAPLLEILNGDVT